MAIVFVTTKSKKAKFNTEQNLKTLFTLKFVPYGTGSTLINSYLAV